MKETAITRDELDMWHLTRELPDFEKVINQKIQAEAQQTFEDGKTRYRWEITESAFGDLLSKVAKWVPNDIQSLFYRYRVKGWKISKVGACNVSFVFQI